MPQGRDRTSPHQPCDPGGHQPGAGRLYTTPITAAIRVPVAHEVTDEAEAFAASTRRGEFQALCRDCARRAQRTGRSETRGCPVTSALDPERRWALSPSDLRSHLLAEQGSAPRGMLMAICGQLMPDSVDTSPYPPTGLRYPTCLAPGASRGICPAPGQSWGGVGPRAQPAVPRVAGAAPGPRRWDAQVGVSLPRSGLSHTGLFGRGLRHVGPGRVGGPGRPRLPGAAPPHPDPNGPDLVRAAVGDPPASGPARARPPIPQQSTHDDGGGWPA